MRLRDRIASTACKRQRGSAMLMVIMLSTFTMGIWMVTFRTTNDAIQTEAFHASAPYFEGRTIKALAYAGELLNDGQPSGSSFRFVYAGQDDRGRFFVQVEMRKRSNGRYKVEAQPAESSALRRLPRNPTGF